MDIFLQAINKPLLFDLRSLSAIQAEEAEYYIKIGNEKLATYEADCIETVLSTETPTAEMLKAVFDFVVSIHGVQFLTHYDMAQEGLAQFKSMDVSSTQVKEEHATKM